MRPPSLAHRAPSREVTELRARLAEAEETLCAIRTGGIDTLLVQGNQGNSGNQVFTLEGAEYAYRALIESMNEGALTLTADATVLYANRCFARMVQRPLEQVLGASFYDFLSAKHHRALRLLLKRTAKSGSKIEVMLLTNDGAPLSVHLSIRRLANNGVTAIAIGLVVTDITETRRKEEMLRALTQRMVEVQEAERGRVAIELHDHITQLLCAILVRSQTLAEKLSSSEGPAKKEAIKLRQLLGQAAEEVERISRNLRPSVLDDLGLVAVLRDTSTEFAERIGVELQLICARLPARLPTDTELTLYRILQEALNNIEHHAHARHVKVNLTKPGEFIQLTIHDDGVGFDPKDNYPNKPNGKSGLGLLSMRERAIYVGGVLKVKSDPSSGTEIEVRIPLPHKIKKGK